MSFVINLIVSIASPTMVENSNSANPFLVRDQNDPLDVGCHLRHDVKWSIKKV